MPTVSSPAPEHTPLISMAMAMDINQLIGENGGMPWSRLPADFRYFRSATLGKPVVMGRKTFDSIGRPLPDRRNIVVTRNQAWTAAGVESTGSLDAALALTGDVPEVVIIGGAQLCREAMPRVQRLYLTIIDHAFAGGDTWLDSFNASEWQVVRESVYEADADNAYRMRFQCLERLTPVA